MITRRGKPVARVSSAHQPPRQPIDWAKIDAIRKSMPFQEVPSVELDSSDARREILMRYLDASAAVPLFVKEASSPTIRRLFADAAPRELALSGWTVAEFTSALGIRTRMRTVTATAAREAVMAFRTLARETLTATCPSTAPILSALPI